MVDYATITRINTGIAAAVPQTGGPNTEAVISADGRYVVYTSYGTNIAPFDTNAASDIFVYDQQTGTTERISVSASGVQANAHSFRPVVSADGRYIAFMSHASNLIDGQASGMAGIYVVDRQSSTVQRVDVAPDGSEAVTQASGNDPNSGAALSISADGRYVMFASVASNLVAGDTNTAGDIFIRDLQTGTTQRVSVASDGTEGNMESGPEVPVSRRTAVMTPDGRFVAFVSWATTLVAGDTNGMADIFVWDRQTGTTERISVASDGSEAMGDSFSPAISADGRYVAFVSAAENLVAGDTNAYVDIFVRDRQTGTTQRVSVALDGGDSSPTFLLPDAMEIRVGISPDGTRVFFPSDADNLVAGDTNGKIDVFVRDLTAGTTDKWALTDSRDFTYGVDAAPSLTGDGGQIVFTSTDPGLYVGDTNATSDVFVANPAGNTIERVNIGITAGKPLAIGGASDQATISADGNVIAYTSRATNIEPFGDTNGESDIFVFDRTKGTTERVSVTSDGKQANGSSYGAQLSADGRYVLFASAAENLVASDTNGMDDLFLHDRQTKTTTRVNVAADGAEANGWTIDPTFVDANAGYQFDISNDGRYVTFISEGSNLVAGDLNGMPDVFIRDVLLGTIELVSRTSDGFSANGGSNTLAMSGDGRYIAFGTDATNLDPSDLNGWIDIYVWDRLTQNSERVSVSTAESGALTGGFRPAISDDGRYVAFVSGDGAPGDYVDVYVRDRLLGTTELVSVAADGGAGNEHSGMQGAGPDGWPLRISADGRYVTFASDASNLVAGDTNGAADLFIRDRQTGTTSIVTAADGRSLSYGSYLMGEPGPDSFPVFSADMQTAVFSSTSKTLYAGDTNNQADVFVSDAAAGTVSRVNFGTVASPPQANSGSGRPFISGNARYVAFGSGASNLVDTLPGDSNGVTDIYVRDLVTGTTERVSVASSGSQGNGASSEPAISDDGRFVVFMSTASNLAGTDANDGLADVFLHDRETGETSRVNVPTIEGMGMGGGSSWGATISGDGRFVAYASNMEGLVAGDMNGMADVFVFDRMNGTTERVSVGYDGTDAMNESGGPGPGMGTRIAISQDGRYVAFVSDADNLVPDDTMAMQDVFVHDRQTHTTERISVPLGGPGSHFQIHPDISPSMSADGRLVAFVGVHHDPADPASGMTQGVYVRDRQAGTTTLITPASNPESPQLQEFSGGVRISPDGRYVSFITNATLDAADKNLPGSPSNGFDVYLHDRAAGTTQLLPGYGTGVAPLSFDSSLPTFSSDGTTMAFATTSSKLFAGDTSGFSDIFVATLSDGANSAPTDVMLSAGTVAENSATGTIVGTVSATDPDGDTLTYTLTDDAGGRFVLDGAAIKVADGAELDYETTKTHAIMVEVSDGKGGTATKSFDIAVADVNEAPVAVDDDLTATPIATEDTNVEIVRATLLANDTDPEGQAIIAYDHDKVSGLGALVTSPGTSTFMYSANASGALQALAEGETAVDSFKYSVTDGTGISNWATVSVAVEGRNDEVNITSPAQAGTVVEDGAATAAGVVTFSDVDLSDSHTADFAASAANTTVYGTFSIDPVDEAAGSATGSVGWSYTVDNAAVQSLGNVTVTETYEVTITDDYGATATQDVTVKITGANDAPFNLAVDGSTVEENAAGGTVVATLAALDVDTGDTLTYSLSSDAGGRFVIVGNEIRVAEGAKLDHEGEPSIALNVRATDAGGLFTETSIDIDVLNVDEAPTSVSLDSAAVDENATEGTLVGTLGAIDPDGTSDFTFSLLNDAGGLFVVEGNELRVAPGALISFEDGAVRGIVVEATDASGLTAEQAFSINIGDLPEAPTDIEITGGIVQENAVAGTVVASLKAIDEDIGDTFTYEILAGGDGLFEIVGDEVRVAAGAVLDYESITEHYLSLRVSDAGGNVIDKDLAVTVENVSGSFTGTAATNAWPGTSEEDVAYGRAGNDILSGGAGEDQLYGEDGNDTLDGGADHDVLTGGKHNDNYLIGEEAQGDDEIVELAGEGTDTVKLSAGRVSDYALGENVENLIAQGGNALTLTGNELVNAITGNAGDNILDGGADELADTLTGGAGNDIYIVGLGDKVVEYSGGGTDEIRTATLASFSLASLAYVENLTYSGGGSFAAIGNSSANTITSGDGDDTLDGKIGADILIGGKGDDTYVVDNVGEMIVEAAGEGNADTVRSSISYTLGAELENLVLTGSAALSGTGNAFDNTITGNSGANTLDGGAGVDVLAGGAGNDTYILSDADTVTETQGQGTDLILTSLTDLGLDAIPEVENLTFTGGTAFFHGRGNELANVIRGGAGGNLLAGQGGNDTLYGGAGSDQLDGGAGADTMRGGAGDDTYVVDDAYDRAIEIAGAGADTVNASISFTLGAYVENLVLFGGGAINGTGNGLDNVIAGNSAANALNGGAGKDTVIGGGGADTLLGGSGADRMRIADAAFAKVDGGTDQDTLEIKDDFDLNLTAIANTAILGIEAIDITGWAGVDNKLTIGIDDVRALSANSNAALAASGFTGKLSADSIVVYGNAGDSVLLAPGSGTFAAGAWIEQAGLAAIGSDTFRVFNFINGSTLQGTIAIDSDIAVTK